jgi:TPR repeat protein
MILTLLKTLWFEGTLNNFTLMTRNLTYCLVEAERLYGQSLSPAEVKYLAATTACSPYIMNKTFDGSEIVNMAKTESDWMFVSVGIMSMLNVVTDDYMGVCSETMKRIDSISTEIERCRNRMSYDSGLIAKKARTDTPLMRVMLATSGKLPPLTGGQGSSLQPPAVCSSPTLSSMPPTEQKRECESAFEEMMALAKVGLPGAQFGVGNMLEDGAGVSQDYSQAAMWYRKAAEQGYPTGQLALGVMYQHGKGVPLDDAQAAFWFRKAAEQGLSIASYRLGMMCEQGMGVPQDDVQATTWYRKGAEQGEGLAQNRLGDMYTFGRGVPQDDLQAAIWYRRAADQGDYMGQRNLGVMYSAGQGVPQNDVLAYMWLNLAAAHGSTSDAIEREKVAARLTPEQRAEAQKMAREWKPTPPK